MPQVNTYYENADYANWSRWDLRNPNQRYDVDNPLFASHYKTQMDGAPKILRGYMRAADPNTANSGGFARLFFQYNPSTIVRNTELMTGVNPQALQNPSDQAGVGSQSFTFALFFDRQAEVASSQSVDSRLTTTLGGVTVTTVGEALSPDRGVLVDLAVFDKITGIGGLGNKDTITTAGANAAILAGGQPVRVIFSPQLMVEGWVDNATVTMQKFNHMMVPVFCEISVHMMIRYWGAAVLDTGGATQGTGTDNIQKDGIPYYIANPNNGPTGTTPSSVRNDGTVASPVTRNYDLTPVRGPF